MANRIVLNEVSYHGSGAIKEIVTEVKGKNLKKAFLCSDPDLIKFGVTTKVTSILDEAGLDYEVYSNIKPNPTIENVQTGVEAYKVIRSRLHNCYRWWFIYGYSKSSRDNNK